MLLSYSLSTSAAQVTFRVPAPPPRLPRALQRLPRPRLPSLPISTLDGPPTTIRSLSLYPRPALLPDQRAIGTPATSSWPPNPDTGCLLLGPRPRLKFVPIACM